MSKVYDLVGQPSYLLINQQPNQQINQPASKTDRHIVLN